MIRYAKPKTTDEALALLAQDRWRMLAGGTDFYPAQGAKAIRDNVLDLNALAALRGISETSEHWMIGARMTWSDVLQADGLPPAFDALRQSAREVGSVQIQNRGTVAGNLCNASPAADGVPPLLVLDAEVELRSVTRTRHVPLGSFLQGNRKTALDPDELMTAIRIPKSACGGRSAFVKLGGRRYLVISIAMAAIRLEVETGHIIRAAVAVGACSAVAQRLSGVEAALAGVSAGPEAVQAAGIASFDELTPIDDVRASQTYRIAAAREIVCRAVAAALGIDAEAAAA